MFKAYLVAYMHEIEDAEGKPDFKKSGRYLEEHFISWFDAKVWAEDLRNVLDFNQRFRLNPFIDRTVYCVRSVEFAEELAHSVTSFHNLDCRALKNKLVDMEFQGTGRVRLSPRRARSGG